MSYNFKIKFDREEDGRWIAEVPSLPVCWCTAQRKPKPLAQLAP